MVLRESPDLKFVKADVKSLFMSGTRSRIITILCQAFSDEQQQNIMRYVLDCVLNSQAVYLSEDPSHVYRVMVGSGMGVAGVSGTSSDGPRAPGQTSGASLRGISHPVVFSHTGLWASRNSYRPPLRHPTRTTAGTSSFAIKFERIANSYQSYHSYESSGPGLWG